MTGFLALHGFTGSPSELGYLTERVAAAGFEVRVPLLPGHGTTPEDLQRRTFAEWLGCAREELAALRKTEKRVIVCGFSMGSLLALTLAAEGDAPDALVLLGCALRLSALLRGAFGAAASLKLRLPNAYVPKPLGPDIRDKTLAASIQSYDRHPVRAAMEVYRAGQTLQGELHKVKCPTLLLHGARDRVCDPAGAREVANGLGTDDVRVRVYPRSAHMIALDYDRDEVARDVIAFCERQVLPVEP